MDRVWLYNNTPVSIMPGARILPEYQPDGQHGYFIQKALDRLAQQESPLPSTVSVDGLGWSIPAIVVPNGTQTPLWAVHTLHGRENVHPRDMSSPFVFLDRTKRAPITGSVTVSFSVTESGLLIEDVYAGPQIPPLPWQIRNDQALDALFESMWFWRRHSFIYNKRFLASKLYEQAPLWTTCDHALSA